MPKHKEQLKTIPLESYTHHAHLLNKKFQCQNPLTLSLDLTRIFAQYTGSMSVQARPHAQAIVPEPNEPPTYHYHSLSFDIQIETEACEELNRLLTTKPIKEKILKKLLKDYREVCNNPKTLEEILIIFDNKQEQFESLVGIYYDVRYHQDSNGLSCHDIYSGHLKNQGLMTKFYTALQNTLNFNDLTSISFHQIVERRSQTLYQNLTKNNRTCSYTTHHLHKKYVKSPFLKILHTLNFKNITIYTHEGRLSAIEGKPSMKTTYTLQEEIE